MMLGQPGWYSEHKGMYLPPIFTGLQKQSADGQAWLDVNGETANNFGPS